TSSGSGGAGRGSGSALMARTPELPPLDAGTVAASAQGRHPQPHSTLGIHQVAGGHVVRAVRPLASAVTATLDGGKRINLVHLADGLWQGAFAGEAQSYTLEASYAEGPNWHADDAYRFPPTV